MKFQTQTSAKITLTQQDIRAALVEYICANGLTVTADDLPESLDLNAEEQVFLIEIVEDTAPAKPAPKRSAPAKKAEPKPVEKPKEEPKPVEETVKAEPVDTMVPDADVEAYRKKKEAEAVAKTTVDPFADPEPAKVEPDFKPETMITNDNEVAHADSISDDDDDLEEVYIPASAKDKDIFAEDGEIQVKPKVEITASIFDDEEPTTKPTTKITASIFD